MTPHTDVPTLQHDTSGSGKTLVLMGGGLTGWQSWIPHAEQLRTSRQIIRIQQHGIALGLTGDPLPPDHSIDYEVAAFAKTLDALAVDQADFAAWSLGAVITLSYALHHPDRVRSLTLIEPPAFWVLRSQGPLDDAMRREQRFMAAMAEGEITEAKLAEFLRIAGIIPADFDPSTLEQWPAWVQHRRSLRFGDAPYVHDDDMALVRAFDHPVLLVKGEGSSPYYHRIIDLLAENFPNAQVVIYPGRHAPHIISMGPFMERFRQFLASA